MEELSKKLQLVKQASIKIANLTNEVKNSALNNIIVNINSNKSKIIKANLQDINKAEEDNLAIPLLKRLKLDEKKIDEVIEGIRSLITLEDPTNKIIAQTLLDDNLILTKKTVPIGVVGVIFESRPDALVQIATLCIKSGNCAILKGGSEALNTNRILSSIIIDSIVQTDSAFVNSILLLETREDVANILQYNQYINLIIPRGSNAFVQYIQKNSSIPVLGHADGICHVYVDKDADFEKAVDIIIDSKTQYVAVCNALETLLVHKDCPVSFWQNLEKSLAEKGVELRCDDRAAKFIKNKKLATEDDWSTEYLSLILSIKVVDSLEEAIEHINYYGSGHTDAIITNNNEAKNKFEAFIDSSSVMVNCSTRFADGFRYGFGAEVGISTNKIHARGPVGLDGLIIYKYLVEGDGQIVDDYSKKDGKKFKHKKLL